MHTDHPGATMPKTNPTINEIAKLAGVSKKSVSRVLNDERGVSEKTRAHIQQIMRDVGYEPDRRARALASARSLLLGLAYNNRNPSYVLELLNGSQIAANALGYEIVMHCVTDETDAAEHLIRFMRRSGCDGLILTPPLSESATLIAALAEQNWPTVRIAGDNADFPVPQIRYNDRTAALSLTHKLISLGHSKIGFIGGPKQAGPTRRRLSGVQDALTLAGIPLDNGLLQFGDFTFESGQQAATALLSMAERPTAIICANDEMAAGVFQIAAARNIKIPEDLSVTGFDNSPIATHLWPPLTSVRQPVRDMTTLAVSLLVNPEIHIADAVQQFEAEVLIRESIAAPRQA